MGHHPSFSSLALSAIVLFASGIPHRCDSASFVSLPQHRRQTKLVPTTSIIRNKRIPINNNNNNNNSIISSNRSHRSIQHIRTATQDDTPTPTPTPTQTQKWTHAEIEWRLEPPPETPALQKIQIRAAAMAIRADCKLRGELPPPVLCPKGGKAELVGYKNGNKIAKFGITTQRGPPAIEIEETIRSLYFTPTTPLPPGGPGVGAILYMFVEPPFRSRGIGELALEAIAAIQTVQGCDFTVLVADDDGSDKLVKWYEKNGFVLAPGLQDLFGSPGGQFGVTMIRPTEVASDIFARCEIGS